MILLSNFKSNCGQQNALISPGVMQSYLPNANRWKLLHDDTNELMPPLKRGCSPKVERNSFWRDMHVARWGYVCALDERQTAQSVIQFLSTYTSQDRKQITHNKLLSKSQQPIDIELFCPSDLEKAWDATWFGMLTSLSNLLPSTFSSYFIGTNAIRPQDSHILR